ncbi:DUF2167 domain-containing protein [uncultured Cardiobacterium sp.]|uniref:DUF2167 domain-containing protein n=1 Tax=uncultured Cardiobacterium sp. TaxID=417619 RepID=UPI00260BEAAB|nr:DUF2167 domain-containing protein [uncultured Cardiobacterium sp.]
MKKLLMAAAAFLAMTLPLWAQQSNDDLEATIMQNARVGPLTIDLGDEATLQLPAGLMFIDKETANKIMEARGGGAEPGRYGIIISLEGWMADLGYVDSGHIKDDDAQDLKADKLMSIMKEAEKKTNKSRRERGVAELYVDGWAQEPGYDKAEHRLIWAIKVHSAADNEPMINYSIVALGRKGMITTTLVNSADQLDAAKTSANELLAAITFKDGNRYSDFNPGTDKVAEYGLTALIAGGLAAKKFGLFAIIGAFILKFAKIFAIAGVALLVGLKKLFSGRRRRDEDDDDD